MSPLVTNRPPSLHEVQQCTLELHAAGAPLPALRYPTPVPFPSLYRSSIVQQTSMRVCGSLLLARRLPLGLARGEPAQLVALLPWQPHAQQQQWRHRQQRRGQRCGLHAQAASAAPATAAPPAASASSAAPAVGAAALHLQTFDYTAMVAATAELQSWVPAKVEGVVQQEHATALRLRTATETGWLWLSYHARTAHVGVGDGPARGAAAELYTFGSQLQATLRGLVLTRIWMPTP